MEALIRQLASLGSNRGWVEQLLDVAREAGAASPLLVAEPDDAGAWRARAALDAAGDARGGETLAAEADAVLLPVAVAQACGAGGAPRAVQADVAAFGVEIASPVWVVPVVDAGRAVAAWLLPADADAERLWLVANLAGARLAAEDARRRLREADARSRREMREVARIQRRLLPSPDTVIRGAEIAARLDTFGLAGGDYYDYMRLTHHVRDDAGAAELDVFGVMVADVTGHGPAAAVEAAMFDALLRAYPGTPRLGPQDVLSYANRHFFTREGRSHLITAVAAVFDPETHTLHYTSAGHPPPLLKRAGGAVERLEGGGGIPIGVLPDYDYEGSECRFEPNDLLVLYTDGVIEAVSPEGEEFGLERLEKLVADGPRSADELLQAIRRAVASHEAGTAPRDDRTLVVVRRTTS